MTLVRVYGPLKILGLEWDMVYGPVSWPLRYSILGCSRGSGDSGMTPDSGEVEKHRHFGGLLENKQTR